MVKHAASMDPSSRPSEKWFRLTAIDHLCKQKMRNICEYGNSRNVPSVAR